MMIHVEITPAQPVGAGHRAEEWMGLTLQTSVGGEALHQRRQPGDVFGERGRPGSRSATLIDLGSRGNARRPWQRAEAEPLDDRAGEDVDGAARGLLAERDQERIGEMAHHLMRRHPPPAPATVGAHRPQPVEQLLPVAKKSQSLDAYGVTSFPSASSTLIGPTARASMPGRVFDTSPTITTARLSGVMYFFATRVTSSGVTSAMRWL